MASKPFKSTLRQQEASRVARAAMTTHRQRIVDGARELYQRVLREGETMIDWEMYQELNLRLMEDACDQLVEADLAQRVETAETSAANKVLSAQANEVRRHMRSVKSDFVWSYGEATLEPFGLNGEFARKSLTLLAQGRYVVVKLRDPGVTLPDPLAEDRALDRESLADDLEGDLNRLDQARKQVEQERKETQEARVTRQGALVYHRRRNVNLTNVLEAYLRLIGLDELADRLRLTITRRSSGTADGDAADGDAAGTTAEKPPEPATEPVTEPS